MSQTKPWGVDVVSGVEKEPGLKDPVKLREFIAAVRFAEPPDEWHSDSPAPYDWQDE